MNETSFIIHGTGQESEENFRPEKLISQVRSKFPVCDEDQNAKSAKRKQIASWMLTILENSVVMSTSLEERNVDHELIIDRGLL